MRLAERHPRTFYGQLTLRRFPALPESTAEPSSPSPSDTGPHGGRSYVAMGVEIEVISVQPDLELSRVV